MLSKHYVSVFFLCVAAALVSGCSGDNPRVLNPSAITTSASATGPVTTAGSALALSTLTTGVAVTTTLGAAPAVASGTTVTLTESTVSPTGLPTLQGLARRPESGTVSDTPLVYIEAVFSNAVTMNGQLGFTTPLPSGSNPNAGPYYVAALPLGATPAWSLAIEGPGVVSGTTVSFTPPVAQVTFAASTPYYYVIYQAVGGSPNAVTHASPNAVTHAVSDADAGSGGVIARELELYESRCGQRAECNGRAERLYGDVYGERCELHARVDNGGHDRIHIIERFQRYADGSGIVFGNHHRLRRFGYPLGECDAGAAGTIAVVSGLYG